MNRKTKIIWFYAIIAAFSFVVIFGMQYLGQVSRDNAEKRYSGFTEAEFLKLKETERQKFSALGLKEDLDVVINGSQKVNLKEALQGKVTVFAQFFSDCPQCEGVNFKVLKRVLETFNEPDLQVVTVNVNKHDTDNENMAAYSEEQAGSSPRWWFANADIDQLNQWSQKNLGFQEFYETEGPQAEILPVTHDMGIVVIGRDGIMHNKEDVYAAAIQWEGSTKEQTAAFKTLIEAQLITSIREALTGEFKTPPPKKKTHIYLAISAGFLVALLSALVAQSKMRPRTEPEAA